jgi:hypothetical protein
MTTQTDATFELIRSLTQNEKRYFRVFSQSSGSDKNYLKVFDALDKMKTYDGKILKQKLSGSKLNVSYEKNYLHKQLLKSLRTFYSENNSAIEIQDLLKSIEIIYRKRLTSQCQKLVERGIAICGKFENWNNELEFIEWQYRIYGRDGNYKKLLVYESEGLKRKEDLLASIRTYAHIQKMIYSLLSIVQNRSLYAEKKVKEEFRKTISECLSLLKKNKNGFRIRELTYSTLYLAYHYSDDLRLAYEYSLATYKLYNDAPHFKYDLPFKYFVAIGNLVNRCIYLKKYEEGLNYISELKSFVKQLPSFDVQDIRQEQRSAVFGYESRILINTHRYSEALIAAKEYEENYNTENLRKNILLADTMKLARIYFVNDLLKESLKRVNSLINLSPDGVKLEFFTDAHLIRMCIQYDLNRFDVLQHHSQTAKRFLEKHQVEDDFAFIFIEMMKQIGKTDLPKKHRHIFRENFPRLKKSAKETFEQYSDLIEWVGEKMD